MKQGLITVFEVVLIAAVVCCNCWLIQTPLIDGWSMSLLDKYCQTISDIAFLDRYIKLHPTDWRAYRARAQAYWVDSYWDRVVADSTQALELKKDDVVSRRLRAYSYYQLDKDDASLSDYNILINSGRGEAQDYAYRSLVNSQTKRFESAASDAAIAVKKDSLCAPAYYARGLSEFHGGSDKDALNDAKLACQLDYELPMPYVLMAMIFNKKQKFDRAILMCEAGLQYDPTNGAAHWQIAAAQVNLKDYDKAIDSCTVALSLADHRAEKSGALSTRALAQFHRSRNEEAIADATKALIFDPECLLAYEVRAMSHDRLNHTNEAAQDREAAKRIKERMTSFQNKTSKSDQNNGTAVITKEQREHNKIHESTNTLRPAPSIKDQRSHRK